MDSAQVKAAIQRDFGIPAEKVRNEENPAERTTLLVVTVPDLIEGAGPARISYILGFKTKKLIQVSILWGTPVDPHAQPEKIITAANQLRQLFVDSGYQPETMIANARLADGTTLVFQGQDAEKRGTVLRRAITPAPPKGSKDKEGGASIFLSLSYTLDSRNPDIFRLRRGNSSQTCALFWGGGFYSDSDGWTGKVGTDNDRLHRSARPAAIGSWAVLHRIWTGG
jgi:hypothetical protein